MEYDELPLNFRCPTDSRRVKKLVRAELSRLESGSVHLPCLIRNIKAIFSISYLLTPVHYSTVVLCEHERRKLI